MIGRCYSPETDGYVGFYQDAYGETPRVFTYIVECDTTGLLKIGKSKTPEWRLIAMQCGSPTRLRLAWCWPEDIESRMHRHFASSRVHGEWFRLDVNEAIAVAARMSKEEYANSTGVKQRELTTA